MNVHHLFIGGSQPTVELSTLGDTSKSKEAFYSDPVGSYWHSVGKNHGNTHTTACNEEMSSPKVSDISVEIYETSSVCWDILLISNLGAGYFK